MTNTKKNKNDEELKQLLEELKYKMLRLKEYGINEKDIFSTLHTGDHPLPKLIISRNYKIFLGDEGKEVHMEPLVKAVYLLFLRHPEGIIFKHLPDYRKELAEIYQMIKPLGLNDRAIRSIEDVTNPFLNSINEKCARIRGAFISQFDESIAKHYYINGWRGEAKKIDLPRELVIWEE
jgi:hypothetical protein